MPDKSWARPFPPGRHLHFSPLRRMQQATDSDGNTYAIFVQNEEFSCALASAAMLIDLYEGRDVDDPSAQEAKLKRIAARFPDSLAASDQLWAKEAVGHYGSLQFGSTADNIRALLKSQGIATTLAGFTKTTTAITPVVINRARLTKPAMVLWGWYRGGIMGPRSGGHFTVAARATKAGAVVILDPWDGSLSEIPIGQPYHRFGYAEVILYTA